MLLTANNAANRPKINTQNWDWETVNFEESKWEQQIIMDLVILNRTRGIKPDSYFAVYLFILFLPSAVWTHYHPLVSVLSLYIGPPLYSATSSTLFFSPTKLFIAVKISSKGNIQSTRRTNALLECTTFRVCEILFLNNLAVSLFSASVIFFNHFSYLYLVFEVFFPLLLLFFLLQLLHLVAMVQNADEQDSSPAR